MALALAGAGVLSIGLVVLSAPVSVAGTVLMLAGAGCSLHGGVLYDAVPGLSPRTELQQVRHGQIRDGVAAGDMVATPRARRDAIVTNQRTRRLLQAAHHPEKAYWAPVAGWACLFLTVVLIASQWTLVAHTATGASNSFRDTGLAILLGAAGIRVAVAPGRHPVAVGVIVFAGLGLVIGAVLAEHAHAGVTIVEIGTGCLAILCALVAYFSSSPPR